MNETQRMTARIAELGGGPEALHAAAVEQLGADAVAEIEAQSDAQHARAEHWERLCCDVKAALTEVPAAPFVLASVARVIAFEDARAAALGVPRPEARDILARWFGLDDRTLSAIVEIHEREARKQWN